MEEIKCDKCEIIKPIDKYREYKNMENSNSETCKKCLKEMDKIRKKNLIKKRLESIMVKCEKCEEVKKLKDFAKLKKFYKRKICISCYPKFLEEQQNVVRKKENLNNINYRLKKSIAARLRKVLKKNNSTMSYIGCNIQYLREWLEYNFTQEMNWENYGSFWLIDNLIPVCKFDLTNENEKLKYWNWSNLVPVQINNNNSIKKEMDVNQVNNIIKKLDKFREEGSTTKWFSRDFMLNKEDERIVSIINSL